MAEGEGIIGQHHDFGSSGSAWLYVCMTAFVSLIFCSWMFSQRSFLDNMSVDW
jgi:hypothetical protein